MEFWDAVIVTVEIEAGIAEAVELIGVNCFVGVAILVGGVTVVQATNIIKIRIVTRFLMDGFIAISLQQNNFAKRPLIYEWKSSNSLYNI